MQQRRIGLTGGIATGKSTVSDYLARQHHLPVLDADVFSREAVAVGSPILDAIAARYGSTILQADGTLDRTQLGRLVFHNEQERQWLEAQIHPYVRDRFTHGLAQYPDNTVIVLSIPLLFETKLTHWVHEIWVVRCDSSQQLTRLMQRNNLNGSEARQRIAAQMPLVQKCERADIVLDNSGTLQTLYAQIDLCLSPPTSP